MRPAFVILRKEPGLTLANRAPPSERLNHQRGGTRAPKALAPAPNQPLTGPAPRAGPGLLVVVEHVLAPIVLKV